MDVLPAPIRPTSTTLRPAIVSGTGIVSRKAVLRVIIPDASTPAPEQAIACICACAFVPASWRGAGFGISGALMIRILFFVVLAGLVALAGGALMLGMFPPAQQPHAVEKVVPNDKFSGH